jgi:hypothetical protein
MKLSIKNIIKEELENFYPLETTVSLVTEQERILTIRDLAEIGSRTGNNEKTLYEIFVDEYRKGGDEAVIELYKSMTGQQLFLLGKGKYSLSRTFSPMNEDFEDKRTPKERFISMLTSILNSGYQPYMLKTRGGGRSGISSAAAYQTKALVDLLPQLSAAELEELSGMNYTNRNGRAFSYKPYIEHFQRLGGEKQVKTDMKQISQATDQYGDLIKQIKEKIEDFLVEQEQKIDADIKKSWEYIRNEYKSMSREEFAKKFGEKKVMRAIGNAPAKEYYTLSMFEASRLGILLRTSVERLPEFIAKAQKAYREKEYGKIDKLIYKLKARYPSLANFVMTNFRKGVDGIEFTLTADNPDGKVSIFTQTIYAGGYNIQRLHLRWLMNVNDAQGKKIKIEQG